MSISRTLAACVVALGLLFSGLGVTSASAEVQAKRYRQFVDQATKIVKQRDGDLIFKTRIKNYANSRTSLQKKNCKRCKWRDIRKKRTNAKGKVSYPVGAPRTGRWYFRVKTPATKRYFATYSNVWYTFTR